MIVGNRDEVYANLFIAGGFWHFNIYAPGPKEPSIIFGSAFAEGTERKEAIARAEAKIKELRIAYGYDAVTKEVVEHTR